MGYEVVDLNDNQAEDIEARLQQFDRRHTSVQVSGSAAVGCVKDGRLIAGVIGCMTVYRIFYVSTVFVDESRRGNGVGRMLMERIEEKAAELGANMIRLDSFNWQGAGFYEKLGYERVGYYESAEDGFSEHFYLKRL